MLNGQNPMFALKNNLWNEKNKISYFHLLFPMGMAEQCILKVVSILNCLMNNLQLGSKRKAQVSWAMCTWIQDNISNPINRWRSGISHENWIDSNLLYDLSCNTTTQQTTNNDMMFRWNWLFNTIFGNVWN